MRPVHGNTCFGPIAALTAVLVVTACSGQIGASDPGGGGGGAGAGGSSPNLDCSSPRAAALHARLLTPTQYNNSLQDLVKVSGNPSRDFSGAVDGALDELSVERRANAAADVARQAAAALAQWSPCTPPEATTPMCEDQIIDRIGMRAYRRPLTDPERAELRALFDAGVKEKDFATGVEWFLAGLFQSPDFLYQFGAVRPGETAGQVLPLPSYELASRLSFFVWDSAPDDALYDAAARNQLGDAKAVRAQVDRLLQDPRFLRGVTGFYSSWLRVAGFAEVARDDMAFTTTLVEALRTSLLMSATQLYMAPSPNITGLFTGQSYYLNGPLRAFYNLPGSRTDASFTATAIPGEDRVGILTHPGLMALLARPNETNPIARGLFVRKALLCQDTPPPPSNIEIPQLPPVSPNLSTRDRLDQHAKTPLCAACHDLIDPPGYALENFDQLGRHRTVEGGKPVDTSGTMTVTDVAGPFARGAELLNRFAQSQDTRSCFAQTYFLYAAGREESAPEDQCTISALRKTFAPSGDLKSLIGSIATSDAFRLRKSEGGAP